MNSDFDLPAFLLSKLYDNMDWENGWTLADAVALAEDKAGESFAKALADARISYVNIADCLWTGDRASTKNAPSRVLIQYDDLSPQSLIVLQERMQ